MQKSINRGFSLIELLVYMTVFSLLTVSVTGLVLWSVRAANKARAVRHTLENAERAMDVISQEVRHAKSIYTPTSSTTQLSLETHYNLPGGEATAYVDIYQCGGALCIKREGSAALPITADSVEIADLRFRVMSTSSAAVSIDLAVRHKNPGTRAEHDALVELHSSATARGF